MVLSKLFRRWFPKFEPKTVPFGEFGMVTSDKIMGWILDQPFQLSEFKVELSFHSGDGGEPAEREVA